MKLSDYLEKDGVFERQLSHFFHRPSQEAIAQRIEQLIEGEERLLLLEAGTGSGKTLAYLLPVFLSGKRTVISTATRTLQDQLCVQEIPAVIQLTGIQPSVAVLKGRANYLCPHRLQQYLHTGDSFSQQIYSGSERWDVHIYDQLIRIQEWSLRTLTGDIAEVENIEESSPVWRYATSTTDNCLSSDCPSRSVCPVYRARDKAQTADLIIVNHHLLFTDLLLKEREESALLPEAEVIVMDEAHQIPHVLGQLSGDSLSSTQIRLLLDDVILEWERLGKDDLELFRCVEETRSAFEELIKICIEEADTDPPGDLPRRLLDECDVCLSRLTRMLAHSADRSPDLARAHERVSVLTDRFVFLTDFFPSEEGEVRWREVQGRQVIFRNAPLEIGSTLESLVRTGDKVWLMTSATLTVNGNFDYFLRESGLASMGNCIQFDSPFDARSMVRYYLPEGIGVPGSPEHTKNLVTHCIPLFHANRGRSFFLFTSYKAMYAAASLLQQKMKGMGFPLLVQGSLPKQQLMEQFQGQERSILLATQSFWEGVDVRGAKLRLLIIDKLPFSHPSDPLVAGKMKRYDNLGLSGFRDYLLPRAVTSLRQGFGRLLRQESDRGLFVLGDSRLRTQGYGDAFKNSLPDMSRVESIQQAIEYMEEISGR